MDKDSPASPSRDAQSGALIRLRGLYPSLKTALKKVADVILRQPEMAIYASVNEVAAACGVSEATVMRFCRILGFRGFQDFKISLARELVLPVPRPHEEVADGDDPANIVRKVFQANRAALQDTLEVMAIGDMEAAGQLLLNSRQVVVVGIGGSGTAVAHAGARFLLLGIKARTYTDFHFMLMAAALLTRDDVVLAAESRQPLQQRAGGRGAGPFQLRHHPGNDGDRARRPGDRGQDHCHHQQLSVAAGPGIRPGAGHRRPGYHAAGGDRWFPGLSDIHH